MIARAAGQWRRPRRAGPALLVAAVCACLSLSSAGLPHAGLYALPPLLEFSNGTQVTSLAQLEQRKAEAKQLLSTTFYGTFPETTPSLRSAQLLNSTQLRGHTDIFAALTFNTPNSATITVEMLLPTACSASAPCPLFMTQTNHRRWAVTGLGRGYIGLIYPGADSNDATEAFRLAYPSATWALIARRAWLGSRALDYALTRPEVNSKQVGITGHSRNGKQSMILAAWDERVTAVISSSSGAPAMSPYRLTSAFTLSESPYGPWPQPPSMLDCSCPRDVLDPRPKDPRCCWWLPSVADLDGHENEMPIDSHALLLLIAPRHFASECALNDPCDPNFAVEGAYMEGKKVYQFYNATDNIRIVWRDGQHHGFEDIQTYFDWFDAAFERTPAISIAANFPEVLLHNFFDWEAWNATHPYVPFPAGAAPTEQIQWLLGTPPPLAFSPGGQYGLDVLEYIKMMLSISNTLFDTLDGVTHMAINFGSYIQGDLYYPENASGPLPAVVWLHPYSYQRGFTEDYPRAASGTAYFQLAKAGFVVLAYHHAGFGHRVQQKRLFYARPAFADWSLLGHLVQDVSSAIDLLSAPHNGSFPDGLPVVDQYGQWYPAVDPKRIFVAGYSLGGIVAAYSCSLDSRCAGAGILSALSPLRNDSLAPYAGGLATLYQQHALQPRLGWYRQDPTALPLDYGDVLAAIAPRPALVYDQQQDRTVNHAALDTMMEAVTRLHPSINYTRATGISKLDDNLLTALVDWLTKQS